MLELKTVDRKPEIPEIPEEMRVKYKTFPRARTRGKFTTSAPGSPVTTDTNTPMTGKTGSYDPEQIEISSGDGLIARRSPLVNKARCGVDFESVLVAEIRIDGKPAGKPRHRSFVRSGKIKSYNKTDGPAASWLDQVLWSVKVGRPRQAPFDGPVRVDLSFYLPRPQRLMRKTDHAGPIPATCKPDRDNADKLILDAMTQAGWWRDDAQVWDGRIRKCYHAKDEIPHAIVRVWVQRQ